MKRKPCVNCKRTFLDKTERGPPALQAVPSWYYGESTQRELEHARRLGKPVEYRAVTLLPATDDLLEIFDPELLAGSFEERKET